MPKTSLKQFADKTLPRCQQYQKFGMKGNVYLPPCLLVFLLAYAYNVTNDAVYRQSLNQNVSKREYWERNERLPKLKVLDCT